MRKIALLVLISVFYTMAGLKAEVYECKDYSNCVKVKKPTKDMTNWCPSKCYVVYTKRHYHLKCIRERMAASSHHRTSTEMALEITFRSSPIKAYVQK